MIKDPRQYTEDYPKSNLLIKQAISVLNGEYDFSELVGLIANLLKNKNDLLINVALNLSPSFIISNTIWQALQVAINETPDIVSTQIFAIPLVLVAGSKTSTSLPSSLDVVLLNEHFKTHQVFFNAANSFISGKLIDPDTLAKIRPSQVYNWVRNLTDTKSWLPIPIEPVAVNVLEEGVFLRFLIGLTTTNNQLGINQESYRNSSMDLMKLISEELKNPAVTLFPIPFLPVPLSEAYIVGNSKRQEIAITVAISNAVRKMRENNLIPVALLDSENEALKISIQNTTNSSFNETSLWHLTKFENYQDCITTITNLLNDMQVSYSYVK
jgi:hypothetical protein